MRRLIFCCDGTWNHIESAFPTNVLKLARALTANWRSVQNIGV
jgi:uncharacterized protein (DUF2235 family)